ncbi:MAG: tetratricopeptide repeat protein [Candidatus Margulisiibacteriota bacterium]
MSKQWLSAIIIIIVVTFATFAETANKSELQLNKLENDVEEWLRLKDKEVILDPITLQEVIPSVPTLPGTVMLNQQLENIRKIKLLIVDGNKKFDLGNYQDAQAAYESALDINPEDSAIIQKVGKCDTMIESLTRALDLFSAGEYHNAIEHLKQVLDVNSRDPKVPGKITLYRKLITYQTASRVKFTNAEYESAINWQKRIIAINPNDPLARERIEILTQIYETRGKAKQAFSNGNYEKVIDYSNTVLSQNPQDIFIVRLSKTSQKIMMYLASSESEFNAGHYKKAIQHIIPAIELNPQDGFLKVRKNIYNKAINLQSDALLYLSLGETRRYINTMKALQLINPYNANLSKDMANAQDIIAIKQKALALYKSEDYEGAITELQKILEVNPKDSKAIEMIDVCKSSIRLRNLGVSLFAMGRYSDAEKVFIEMRNTINLEEKVTTILINPVVPGTKMSVMVTVSKRVKPDPSAASITLLGEKKLLDKAGDRTWKGDYLLPKTLDDGNQTIKTRVALTNGQILTSFTDITVSKPAAKAKPVSKPENSDKWLIDDAKKKKDTTTKQDNEDWLF